MLAELKRLNEKIPENERIPYNMTRNTLNVLFVISSDFKKIIIQHEKEANKRHKILVEFNNNRSSNIYPCLGIDMIEYVFGEVFKTKAKDISSKKHVAYMEKLKESLAIPYISRLFDFLKYVDGHKKCRDKIISELRDIYEKSVPKDLGFISFHFEEDFDWPLHEDPEFINHISRKPENKSTTMCGLCGSYDYPISDVKSPKVFGKDGVIASFNFKSGYPAGVRYGNKNTQDSTQAGVCKKCYFEAYSALQYLLYNGTMIQKENTKVTSKKNSSEYFLHSNRRNFANGEILLFWSEKNGIVPEISELETDREFKPFFDTVKFKGESSLGIELDSPKQGKRNIPIGDPDAFYMFSVRKERGALPLFSPKIGSVIQLRKNLDKWGEDVQDVFSHTIPSIYILARALFQGKIDEKDLSKNIEFLRMRRMLYTLAIDNIALNHTYSSTIINNYLYKNLWIGTAKALLNLIGRNKSMVDERYKKIGEVFSLMKSVRFKAKATGQERFDVAYLSALIRSPRFTLTKLFEENTFHVKKLNGGGGAWYDREIKKLMNEIDISSLPIITTSKQQSNITSGYINKECERMSRKETNKEENDEVQSI